MASGNKSQIYQLHSNYCIDRWTTWREKERDGKGGSDDREDDDVVCQFPAIPLDPSRNALAHQMIALYPDAKAGNRLRAVPDAAGGPFDRPSDRETWLSRVKWAVNQNTQRLSRSALLNLSCRPGIEETVLNTGADPIRDGDDLFVRIPTRRDVQAQRNRLPFDQHLLPIVDASAGAPLFATFGVAPVSVDPSAHLHMELERYRQKYSTGQDANVAANLKVERIELTTVIQLAGLATTYFRELGRNAAFKQSVEKLATHFQESVPVNAEKVVVDLRNSDLFLTDRGVSFHLDVLKRIYDIFANAQLDAPVGRVTQAHEQGKDDQTEAQTGELFRMIYF